MERLTKDFSELSNGKEYTPCISCDSRGLCNYCDYPEKAVAGGCYLMDIYNRLAAYEDTGLTPEEVEHTKLSLMGKAISEITEFDGMPIDRLKELSRADREGLVVVLPCRVGRRVYVPDFEAQTVANIRVQGISITPTGRVVLHFGGYPAASAWGDRCWIDWFLTYEGAEAALRRTDNG